MNEQKKRPVPPPVVVVKWPGPAWEVFSTCDELGHVYDENYLNHSEWVTMPVDQAPGYQAALEGHGCQLGARMRWSRQAIRIAREYNNEVRLGS